MNIGLGSPNEFETQNHLEPVLSPNDKSEIAISTALTISVFKLTILPNLTQRKSSLTSPSPFLTLVSERNTHSHLVDPSAEAICIAWKPDRKYRYIFAVGFNNATVILLNLSPNQRDNPHYINSVYPGGGNRTCSSLVWNPVEPQLLAIGFTKVSRPDQSLRIWDVTCSPDQISGGLGSVFPGITTGHVTSLCWVPNSDQSLAYSNKSGVGVYDYNKRKLRGRPNRSKAIHGLCTDSLSRLYVASFYDLRVRVWGIGDLTQPLLCLDTAHPIVSIVWSTLRARTLLVLTSYPHVYLLPLPSVPHAGTEKEGQENTDWLCNLICEPLHTIHAAYPSSRFSFLPHPTSRGSFLLLQFPAPSPQALRLHPTIEELPLPAFTSIRVSPRDCLVSASDLQLSLAALPMESSSGGFMRRYVEAGYCFDPKRNLEVCREQGGLGLARLWEWVLSVEKGLEGSAARSQVCDVMLNGLAKSVLREVRIDKTQSDCCDVSPDSGGRRRAMPCWQQFPSRELCLRLLGWFPPVEGGKEGVGKTALCSLLSSPQQGPKKAIQALQSAGTGSSTGEVGAVVMALAGYSSSHQDNFWVDTCLSQTETLTDPYLRLCVSLLYSDYDAVPRTIKQERISSNDKFALACAYLRDRDLDKFGSDLLKEIQDQSLLEGLFLTGLGELGILVMKNFLSRGGDLLTVSILSSFTLRYSLEIGTSLSRDASEHIQAWWDSLCYFLDRCRLWNERCRLEIERGRLLDHKIPDSLFKWHVLCGFCGKQIAGGDRKELRGRRHGSTHPTPEKCSSPGSCCPACFKPLPRCVVCHRHMGSSADHVPNGTSAPTDDWMTWCQTCCHWGHSKHISDWFRENSVCPAPGCSCLCLVNNQLLS